MESLKFKRHLKLDEDRLDVTPLIDVVFLLLIFFMLTSTFVLQPGIKVKLPKAITSEALKKENLVIVITAGGKIYLDNEIISPDELSARLEKAAQDERAVLIKADQKISLGRVVEVWDLCRDVGITQVSIATEP